MPTGQSSCDCCMDGTNHLGRLMQHKTLNKLLMPRHASNITAHYLLLPLLFNCQTTVPTQQQHPDATPPMHTAVNLRSCTLPPSNCCYPSADQLCWNPRTPNAASAQPPKTQPMHRTRWTRKLLHLCRAAASWTAASAASAPAE